MEIQMSLQFVKDLKRMFPRSIWKRVVQKLIREARNLYWNIKNVVLWMPILWNNWDFDESFLLRIMEHKFELMEKFFASDNAVSADAPKAAHQCKICKNLCRRLTKRDAIILLPGMNEPVFSRPWKTKPIKNEEGGVIAHALDFDHTELETKYILLANEHEEHLIQQDIEYLCRMFRKHLKKWWD